MTAPAPVVTGKWYALAAVFADQKFEFEAWQQIVETEGGVACPERSAAAGSTAYCRFAGDHRFHVPQDVVRPVEGARMGRFG